MATYYRYIGRDIQVSEATTVKRQVTLQVGTSEAKTVTRRKAGGSFGASSSTATTIADSLFELTIVAGDLDTEGELSFKLQGATDTDYLYGLRIVDHDPFDDIAAILADTGTDGVVLADGAIAAAKLAADCITSAKIADDALANEHFAAGALGPAEFANRINYIPQEIQVSEATTARRTIYYQVGTSEAQTVTVSKAGGAFGASSSAATTVDGTLFKLTIVAGDLDTAGELAFKSQGATNTQYITGISVVTHDPYEYLQYARQALCGKVVTDTSDNTVKVYDESNNLLFTRTLSTVGTTKTWTPS